MTWAPTVSVVLPTFNRAHTLGRAIESVLSQDLDGLELIVVDDASTDGTREVLKTYSGPNVRVVTLPENRGPAGARNVGAAAALGRLLAFQDSDDRWVAGRLQEQVGQLSRTSREVAVSYGRIRKAGPGGRSMSLPGRNNRRLEGELLAPLSQGNFIGLPSTLIRRDAFESVGGFDEQLRCLEDWELFLRLAVRYRFVFLDRVVVESPFSEGGVNDSAPHALLALQTIEKRHADHFDSLAKANLVYLRGDAFLRLGQVSRGRACLLEALQLDPRLGKAWFAMLASIGGRGPYVRLKASAARARHGR